MILLRGLTLLATFSLAFAFLPIPLAMSASEDVCVSETGCSASNAAVCVNGPCASEFLVVALFGDAQGCSFTVSARGKANSSAPGCNGVAFGWYGATTSGGNSNSVTGPASGGWTGVSVNGHPAEGNVALTVWGTANGHNLALAPIGSANCSYWYACAAVGINGASCGGAISDPLVSNCVAVGGVWGGSGATCADADVDLIFACADLLIV